MTSTTVQPSPWQCSPHRCHSHTLLSWGFHPCWSEPVGEGGAHINTFPEGDWESTCLVWSCMLACERQCVCVCVWTSPVWLGPALLHPQAVQRWGPSPAARRHTGSGPPSPPGWKTDSLIKHVYSWNMWNLVPETNYRSNCIGTKWNHH